MSIYLIKTKMKIRSILLLVFIISLINCQQVEQNIRFADGPMMRKHHNEPAPNADNITVHLIPHSHDDVGWLKTVDDYFYGAKQNIQWAGVQYTIDTVVSELVANPSYKFSIVQMAFLYRWWNGASDIQKEQMKTLVKNGQLQFINGGWCMSDQATPYYQDIVDQMTIGLRWLQNTLNYVPDVAWHIDPFGHQASSASLFNQMGFQSFFFARIDYQDKDKRMSEKSLQMIWSPKLTVPDSSNYIFTHVNYYHYSPPPGFCFDVTCLNADPIRDDQTTVGYNIVEKSNAFVNYFKSMSLHFRSNNLMHTMGEDFHYANARMWYKNMDKLIKFINSKPQFGVKFKYSTPSAYVKAIQAENQKYPRKQDDFFPYSDNQNSFWTGYFTSRVAVKGFVRDFGRWLQAVRKQISQIKMRGNSDVIKNNGKVLQEFIWGMEMAMGILQHHDAVAGTQKQKVAEDYILTALKSIEKFTPLYRQIIKQFVNQQIGESPAEQNIAFNIYWNQTAKQLGIAQKITSNKTVLLALYNPGPAKKRQIRIPVPDHDLKVTSWTNTSIPGDVICGNIYDVANCELIINLDFPESSNTYIKITSDSKTPSAKVIKVKEMGITEATKQFKLTSNASIKVTRSTQKLDLTIGGAVQSFFVNYNYYEAYQDSGQKSGAYIFRPAGNSSKKYSTVKATHYAEGTQMVVITFDADKTYTQLYFSKLEGYVNSKGFEIQTKVDSIPVTDRIGKQVVLNLVTTYQNNKTFYTDSNGLQEQVRVLNYRPTWPLVVHQPVAGNYYPVNSHIGIKDTATNKTVTVLTDRTQGGSVLQQGSVQLMIHRRLLMDDARGVGEPLNQTQPDGKGLIQMVRHYVVFGSAYRQVQMQNDQRVVVNIIDTTTAIFSKRSPNPVAITVPQSVKLFLRPFLQGSYLLRLQNFDKSQASVTLPDGWTATEFTLAANQLLSDWKAKQYKWNVQSPQGQQQQIQEQVPVLNKLKSWATKLFSKQGEKKQRLSTHNSNDIQTGQTITLDFLKIRTFKIIKSA